MNNAQVIGMREFYEAVSTPAFETMTAREMALIPHDLNPRATIAWTRDGKRFNWNKTAERWDRVH